MDPILIVNHETDFDMMRLKGQLWSGSWHRYKKGFKCFKSTGQTLGTSVLKWGLKPIHKLCFSVTFKPIKSDLLKELARQTSFGKKSFVTIILFCEAMFKMYVSMVSGVLKTMIKLCK